jgi:hypothetical protein
MHPQWRIAGNRLCWLAEAFLGQHHGPPKVISANPFKLSRSLKNDDVIKNVLRSVSRDQK